MSTLTHEIGGTGHHHLAAMLDEFTGRLGGLFDRATRAAAASRECERLFALTDAELSQEGLERSALPRYLARKYL